MAVDIQVTMLFVDQGMGNLIELVDTSTKEIVFRALVDFGSSKSTACVATVDWLADEISVGTKAKLDFLIISHKDNDHWSLLRPLAEKLLQKGHSLEIKAGWHGNRPEQYNKLKNLDDAQKKGKTIIEYMSKYVQLYPLVEKGSSYKTAGALKPIASSHGVDFKIVTVNVPSGKSKADIISNTQSLVLAIEGNGKTVFLPGDATAETCVELNEILESKAGGVLKGPLFLSVPHHGALRTLASNYTTTNPDLDVGKAFAKNLSPKSIGASAGFATHHHPSKIVLDLFAGSLDTLSPDHAYVVYDAASWVAPETEKLVYTTYLNLPPTSTKKRKRIETERAHWCFFIDPNGDLWVQKIKLEGHAPSREDRILLIKSDSPPPDKQASLNPTPSTPCP